MSKVGGETNKMQEKLGSLATVGTPPFPSETVILFTLGEQNKLRMISSGLFCLFNNTLLITQADGSFCVHPSKKVGLCDEMLTSFIHLKRKKAVGSLVTPPVSSG